MVTESHKIQIQREENHEEELCVYVCVGVCVCARVGPGTLPHTSALWKENYILLSPEPLVLIKMAGSGKSTGLKKAPGKREGPSHAEVFVNM